MSNLKDTKIDGKLSVTDDVTVQKDINIGGGSLIRPFTK